jgi:hypothetical protein
MRDRIIAEKEQQRGKRLLEIGALSQRSELQMLNAIGMVQYGIHN